MFKYRKKAKCRLQRTPCVFNKELKKKTERLVSIVDSWKEVFC